MMPRYTKASLNFCRQGSNRNQITQARKALSSPHTGIESLKLYYIRLFLTQPTGGFIIFAVCGGLRQKSQFVFQILKRIKKLCFYFRLINKINVRLRGIIKCLCSEQLIFLYAVLRIQSVLNIRVGIKERHAAAPVAHIVIIAVIKQSYVYVGVIRNSVYPTLGCILPYLIVIFKIRGFARLMRNPNFII